MRKVIVFSFVLLFIVGASLATAVVAKAAPNVASLTNEGSVLVFPLIDTRDGAETFIKITNTANSAVRIKCFWVNVGDALSVPESCDDINTKLLPPVQTPTDFVLTLTRNQPVMFAASTGENDQYDPYFITAAPFYRGNKGYLACWAVNENNAQINWNYLRGQAIVSRPFQYIPASETDVQAVGFGPKSFFEYSAWALGARSNTAGNVVGTPGTILFNATKFDSTPMYLDFTFPAVGFDGFKNLELYFVQGSQNFLTMAKTHHVTKASFAVWNQNEVPFSGVGACTFCWKEAYLNEVTNGSFFNYDSLGSSVGRFRVKGVSSSGCVLDLTENQQFNCFGAGTTFVPYSTGLLGLAVQSYQWNGSLSVNAGGTSGQMVTDSIVYDPTVP